MRSVRIPEGVFDGRPFGFAQVSVVSTPLGEAVHVAGQVAWDSERQIVGAGDIGKQLRKCLENLSAALASAGATLDQVGALTLYIKQSHMSEGGAIGEVLKSVFGANLPCSTWIGVTSLAVEEFLIEVEPSVVYLPKRG